MVPSTILTTGNPNCVSNLNLQPQELTLPRVATSAEIEETRNTTAVNNSNSIASCQSPIKPMQLSQVYEERSTTNETQTNAKVYQTCYCKN